MFETIDQPEVNQKFKSRLHHTSSLVFSLVFDSANKFRYNFKKEWNVNETIIFDSKLIF